MSGQLEATDIDSASLTFALAESGGPTDGTLTIDADGFYTYTPDEDFNGEDGFTFTVSDGEADPVSQTATIMVITVSASPVPQTTTASTDEDLVLDGQLVATDLDDEDLIFALADGGGGSKGSVTISRDGSFTYTPDDDFNGEDMFTYTVSDGNTPAVAATFTVTVDSVNDAPIAEDAAAEGAEDTPISGQLAATDIDSASLTFSLMDGGAPSNGSVTIGADGAFVYTSDDDFSGTDRFTYQVSDGSSGADTATATLTVIAVNDAPIAQTTSVSTNEDTTLNGQLAASDIDGDDLTFVLFDGEDVFSGALTLETDGSFTYTPDPNFSGQDSFVYEVTDGNGGRDTQILSITVNPVNDAPIFADRTVAGDEDSEVDTALFADDIDRDSVVFAIAPNGVPSSGTATITSLQRLIYKPTANFFGLDTVTIIAADGNGGQTTATITLDIVSVNDAPTADAFSFEVDKGASFVGQLESGDVEGNALTFSLDPDIAPSEGDVTINADGSFTYTAENALVGTDTFGFLVSDGQGGMASAVASVTLNEAPNPSEGTSGADAFEGESGADTFNGGAGNDTITGGGGGDSLAGGGGSDEIAGGGGRDLLEGAGGRDLLQGGGGRDTLDGGGGKDTLEGGNGRDDILGGRGSDTLTGDGGNDRFIFDRGNGRDTNTDFQQNRDKIVVEGGAESFEDLMISQVGNDVLIRIANTRVKIEDNQVDNFTDADFIF